MEEAQEFVCDAVESGLVQRAVEGVPIPILFQGNLRVPRLVLSGKSQALIPVEVDTVA